MITEKEIINLKKDRHELERKIEDIGDKQFPTVVKLSEELDELLDLIDTMRERGKQMENADISPRIKMMKKGVKISKELGAFEANVGTEFEAGRISAEVGKKFIEIIKLIKSNKPDIVEKEFEPFSEVIEINKKYEQVNGELEGVEKVITREQNRINHILDEIKELQNEIIDIEKVKRYAQLTEDMGKLDNSRKKILHEIVAQPIIELITYLESNLLVKYVPNYPKEDQMKEIKKFLSENSELGKKNANLFCEVFGYSDKKLTHICPDITGFKKIVLSNKQFFERLGSLDESEFLSFDEENEKMVNFYIDRINGSKDIIERIKIQKSKRKDREEYERSKDIQKKKEELSEHSNEKLKKELKEMEILLVILHSELKKEEKKEGLISRIISLFKS